MLDKRFWEHAFLTTVYVRNKVWSQGSKCIPYEAVFKKLLDLSNLRVFGCQVFSHVDKSRHHKLSPKATEGVFIGYATDCPAWLSTIRPLEASREHTVWCSMSTGNQIDNIGSRNLTTP
jgi:hypothetical protein